MTSKSTKPISFTPLSGIDSNTIECNPQMFAMWLNDLVETFNYVHEILVGLHNENLETRRRLDCMAVDLEALKKEVHGEGKGIAQYESRIQFLERQLNGSSGMMSVVEAKVDDIINRLPGAIADLPADWRFAGGSPEVIDEIVKGTKGGFSDVKKKVEWLYGRLPFANPDQAPSTWKFVGGDITSLYDKVDSIVSLLPADLTNLKEKEGWKLTGGKLASAPDWMTKPNTNSLDIYSFFDLMDKKKVNNS